MRPHLYILDDKGEPVGLPCNDDYTTDDLVLIRWGKFFEKIGLRRVARETVCAGVDVSTVFLGMDHGWGDGPPVLWETMIFGDGHPLDQDMMRCSGSREQAEAMHRTMVEKVKRCALKEG